MWATMVVWSALDVDILQRILINILHNCLINRYQYWWYSKYPCCLHILNVERPACLVVCVPGNNFDSSIYLSVRLKGWITYLQTTLKFCGYLIQSVFEEWTTYWLIIGKNWAPNWFASGVRLDPLKSITSKAKTIVYSIFNHLWS